MRELTGKQQEVLGFIRTSSRSTAVPPPSGDRRPVQGDAASGRSTTSGRSSARAAAAAGERGTDVAGADADGSAGARHARGADPRPCCRGAAAARDREPRGELHIAPASLPGRAEDLFALRVRGESMIEAHICDGDLVLVRRQDSASQRKSVALVE